MKKEEGKYIFWAIIALLVILSVIMIKPYLVAIITAFVLAYLLMPVFKRLNKKLNKSLSALICLLIILIVIIIPLGGLIGEITTQAYSSLNSNAIEKFVTTLSNQPFLTNLNIDIPSLTSRLIEFIISLLTSVIYYLPSLAISILIILLGTYYILVDWDLLAEKLKGYLPFKQKEKVAKEISNKTKAIIYGSLFIAIIEFIVTSIGFYFSGVPYFLFLALIVAIFAFIPGVGPGAVWVPTAIVYLFSKNYPALIGVVITGLILSIGVDAILRAKIIGDKTRINPFVLIIGILGGISLFGIFGFIIGPLILVYTIELIEDILKNR